MKKAVFVDGTRTPFLKAGSVPNLNAVKLGVSSVDHLLSKYSNLQLSIDYVIGANIGNQFSHPDGSNIARVIVLNTDIPQKVGTWTVNNNCASGLHAVVDAAKHIELGMAKCVIAVAVECMSDYGAVYSREQWGVWPKLLKASRSKQPWQKKLSEQLKIKAEIKLMPHDPLWMLNLLLVDPVTKLRMDQAANETAEKWGISRKEQDLFALESQRRASVSQRSGRLAQEISPFGDYKDDNGIRHNTTLTKLSRLKPSYPGGTITAGNSSQISDGACAIIVAEEEFAKSMGWPTKAVISSQHSAIAGSPPARFALGPVNAIKVILERTGLQLTDFDLVETNEAFAAAVLTQIRAFASKSYCSKLGLGYPMGDLAFDITNVNGGAIAIGHPLGASGARLLLTCVKEMEIKQKTWGLVTLCAAGGQGEALAVERRKS